VKSTAVHGHPWASMGIYGHLWASRAALGIPCQIYARSYIAELSTSSDERNEGKMQRDLRGRGVGDGEQCCQPHTTNMARFATGKPWPACRTGRRITPFSGLARHMCSYRRVTFVPASFFVCLLPSSSPSARTCLVILRNVIPGIAS